MRVASKVVLSPRQRNVLERWARSRWLPWRQVERARIVLRAAEGRQDKEMGAELSITNPKAPGGEADF